MDVVLKESPIPWSPLRARSRIFLGEDTLVVVLLACYEMLEFWIEYAYLLGTKMSCCPIQASHVLLIGPKYVISVVVVCCLSIPQCTPVLKREPRFVPQVRPCGQTVLKSGLRWSATWWRGHYRKKGHVRQPKTNEYMFIADEHNLCTSGNQQT
jgi:hypothetical protein